MKNINIRSLLTPLTVQQLKIIKKVDNLRELLQENSPKDSPEEA